MEPIESRKGRHLAYDTDSGGTTTAIWRAFDTSLQMLIQMREKAEPAKRQSEPEMEEAGMDASEVDSSAEAAARWNAVGIGRESAARAAGCCLTGRLRRRGSSHDAVPEGVIPESGKTAT